jgi:hypothetical protein
MESYIDFGFKQEMTRLYVLGFMLKRQLLNPDATKAFEPQNNQSQFFNHLFKYKSLKECTFMSKLIESGYKVKKEHKGVYSKDIAANREIIKK